MMLLSIIVLAGCSASEEPRIYSIQGPIMGTQYHVKVVLPAEREALLPQLKQGIFDALTEVDQLMSTYKPSSEVSRFNAVKELTWFELSPATFEVVKRSQELSENTGGAFDITVGPLVNLWGFGPQRRADEAPLPEQIQQVREYVGYQLLELDESRRAIRKRHPELYIDLSAIAKGYAVDQVAEYLQGQSVNDFLVEVGGEIRVNGQKPGGELWRLAIEVPQPEQRAIEGIVELTGKAMATSGDYRNYYEKDGKRYSHTIAPPTGYPITHSLAAVSVIHESCATADALATAFMVMGTQQAMEYAVEQGIAAYFIDRVDNEFVTVQTEQFKQFLK